MNRVLIVDDEASLLVSLKEGLSEFRDQFTILTANSVREALELLEQEDVDLVVTDLRMPEMDGFALLAELSANYPTIPAIVMTAHANAENEDKLRSMPDVGLIEKPVDFDALTQKILDRLNAPREEGSISGISLPNFLELLEREEKTCLLQISVPGGSSGLLLLNQGNIWNAVYEELRGEEALFAMLSKKDVRLNFLKLPRKKIKRRIHANLMALLLDWALKTDESDSSPEQDDDSKETSALPAAMLPAERASIDESDATLLDKSEIGNDAEIEAAAGDDLMTMQQVTVDTQAGADELINTLSKGDETMGQMEDILGKLRDIEGFNAAGVFSPEGEMVAQVNSSGMKIEEIGALANDVLLKAQKATEIMGVGRGQIVHIEAPKAHVLSRCLNESTDFSSNTQGRAHIHVVVVIAKEGNVAMSKIRLNSVIGELAPLFR